MNPNAIDQDLEAVAAALRQEKKCLLTAHTKPDGDALGSMAAMQLALAQLGADSAMYLAGADPIPAEYLFLDTLSAAWRGELPPDSAARTLIALDCGNAERIGNDQLVAAAPKIINIDHHGDNSGFGDINLVAGDASSTAEIVYHILQRLDVEITPQLATALYTGILVDSGRFQYASTTAVTFQVAADLINRGVEHTAIFHHIYENVPLAKAKLLCRMLSGMVIRCDGKLAVGVLDAAAFRESGAAFEQTDGLVNNLRAIEGVEVGALIYARPSEEPGDDTPHYRVSLRSAADEIDVQRIASLKHGGGHRQASGFSADETPEEIIEFLTTEVSRAL
ncbi:MAG: bifunctional oligoribonuclease/PAP phosphatase NrnA [Chloroflexi bacterium]|nr:bifunctional oligoribonuclease/PAP phosphatase NrnA [Chloroflexota bacterium]